MLNQRENKRTKKVKIMSERVKTHQKSFYYQVISENKVQNGQKRE